MAVQEENQAIRQNLLDAGCTEELIERYFRLGWEGDQTSQKALLHLHRCRLLESVHREQTKIDCLDWLLYKQRETEKEEG